MIRARTLALASLFLAPAAMAGCSSSGSANVGASVDPIVDVEHTPVERQSIGNCWIYAQATWVESMHKTEAHEDFDVSQSYWTYWHWFDEITGGSASTEVSTGGNQFTSNQIVIERGVVPEGSFVPEDTTAEMSARQSRALNEINREIKEGVLKTPEAREDAKLVRTTLNKAWGLSDEVKALLDTTFGEDGRTTLSATSASPKDTPIISAADFKVKYSKRAADGTSAMKSATLADAMNEWRSASYPSATATGNSSRRGFLTRVQRALHDRQPVVVTWNVEFNAMESGDNERRGSFNMTTLTTKAKPGHQGGHMTVLEDYEAETTEFGLLKAGVTLDPSKADDQLRLDAALLPTTTIKFLRIKNSWGAVRDDRSSAPGFPGYHDLYMDYLNGPISWCPDEKSPTVDNCKGTTIPLRTVLLPPGY